MFCKRLNGKCQFVSIFTVLLLVSCTSEGGQQAKTVKLPVMIQSMNAMAKRLFADRSNDFVFKTISSDKGKDVFEIETLDKKVVVRGNNGISMARGLNWYLKYYCHHNVSWRDTRVFLKQTLPVVSQKVRKSSWARDRYFLNYVTFGYSMPWWNFDQWEMFIDWMALNGINMPLSVTGQEAVWQSVYQKMGMTDAEIANFFTGPPYLPFSWMGCLDSFGGPLPKGWVKSHEKLQLNILKRQRELGMKPVLQSFTGHIPAALLKKHSSAKSQMIHWGDWETHLLDPYDPLFAKIASLYMKEQTKLYGTDHLYAADAFIEMKLPSGELDYVKGLSKAIYNGMAQEDPNAVWVFQSWPFMLQANYWTEDRVKTFLDAIDDDAMLIIDLWCEQTPLWSRKNTKAFHGKPWMWCNVQSFGNKTYMGGDLDGIFKNLQDIVDNPEKNNLTGVGFANEGLDWNAIIYDLMYELPWAGAHLDQKEWVKKYIKAEYGQSNKGAEKAWDILQETVYKKAIWPIFNPVISMKPTLENKHGMPFRGKVRLADAWRLLQEESATLGSVEGYRFDLVNLARQTLTNHAYNLYNNVQEAYKTKDLKKFDIATKAYIDIMNDMDQLLASRKDYLLGVWLEDAKRWGETKTEKNKLEWNARRILTIWSEKKYVNDYAFKEWAGLLSDYYAVRWQKYFDKARMALQQNKEIDHEAVLTEIRVWEEKWVDSHNTYPTKPKGDCIKLSKKFLNKYFPRLEVVKTDGK